VNSTHAAATQRCGMEASSVLAIAVAVPVGVLAVCAACVLLAYRRWRTARAVGVARRDKVIDALTTSLLLTANAGVSASAPAPAGESGMVEPHPGVDIDGSSADALPAAGDVADQVLAVADVIVGEVAVEAEVAVSVPSSRGGSTRTIHNPLHPNADASLTAAAAPVPLSHRMSVGGRFRRDTVQTVALSKEREAARRPSAAVSLQPALRQARPSVMGAPSPSSSSRSAHSTDSTATVALMAAMPRHLLCDVIMVALDVAQELADGGSPASTARATPPAVTGRPSLLPPTVRLFEEMSFYSGLSGTGMSVDGADTTTATPHHEATSASQSRVPPPPPARPLTAAQARTAGVTQPAGSVAGFGAAVATVSPPSPALGAAPPPPTVPPPPALRPRANLMSVRGLPREVLEAVLHSALASVGEGEDSDSDDADAPDVDAHVSSLSDGRSARGATATASATVVEMGALRSAATSTADGHASKRPRGGSSVAGREGDGVPAISDEARRAAMKAAALSAGRAAMAARAAGTPFTRASTRTLLAEAGWGSTANATTGGGCRWLWAACCGACIRCRCRWGWGCTCDRRRRRRRAGQDPTFWGWLCSGSV